MAVADAPGLMDIASTLAQDEIPFKLRCAICNNLAVNAFRLPCCDQSICETCQASLSDTCPVCTHTPVSPDLCKPNKALRTTLKAFLRTEEKKREKDRQSVATNDTPADIKPSAESTPQNGEPTPAREPEAPLPAEPTEPTGSKPEVPEVSAPAVDPPVPHTAGESAPEPTAPDTVGVADAADHSVQHEAPKVEANTEPALEAAAETPAEPTVNGNSAPAQEISDEPSSTSVPNTGGNFPPMGWSGNATNPYMAGMYNFPNSMGMSMGMDPMVNQGMFGDYGMNMTGMGMNSGMNYNGGMYGSLGWDASQNNNMWQGGQDKFNPNAFANGTGPPHGGAFGSNMSYPSSDYQSGYYGQGYGRGGFRGRGRGQYHGPGRGGFGPMHGHYRANSGYSNQNPTVAEGFNQGNPTNPESSEHGVSGDIPGTDNLQGIPTIDSLQSVSGSNASPYYAPGPGVEGAPAAPRAMRQGLPNTSVFRQRGFQIQGRASSSGQQPDTANVQGHAQSRSRSKSPHPTSRPHSPSVHGTEDGQDGRRELETKPMDRVEELQSDARRSPSPSRTSSRRSSRRRHHDSDRERDRKDSHRSQRSRRHRSPSHTSSRNGDSRPSARLNVIEENNSNGRTKRSSEAPESRDLASRISSSRRSDKDRVSRREDDRSRAQDRDSRRRDRDRDRDHDRDRRDRDRDTDRERRRDDRDKDRTADRDRDRRDRPKDRERDRKRSRRDRSPSANGSDHPHARRVKRDEDRSRGQSNGASTKKSEPEKDPYTLEREARNKERLQREQQHREKAKSGRRRDSRQDRVVGGRRINYKYEDEL